MYDSSMENLNNSGDNRKYGEIDEEEKKLYANESHSSVNSMKGKHYKNNETDPMCTESDKAAQSFRNNKNRHFEKDNFQEVKKAYCKQVGLF